MSFLRALAFVAAGAVIALGAILVFAHVAGPRDAAPQPPQAAAADLSVEDMVAQSLPSVVAIEVLRADGGRQGGSGFIVAPHGTCVTNRHVIDGAVSIEVLAADGTRCRPTDVRGFDGAADLAVLVLPRRDLPALSLREAPDLRRGEAVVAIGHPAGLTDTVTEGVVSGLRDLPGGRRVIQTSAPISRGNSGGPLLDRAGRVVGVVSFKLAGNGMEGLAFAVPAADVAELHRPGVATLTDEEFYVSMDRGGPRGGPRPDAAVETRGGLTGVWAIPHLESWYALLQEGQDGTIAGALVERRAGTGAQRRDVLEERASFTLERDGGRLTGSVVVPWSCHASRFARDRDGTFRSINVANDCGYEVALELVASGPGRLHATWAAPDVPEAGADDYAAACDACLQGRPSRTITGTWRQVGG